MAGRWLRVAVTLGWLVAALVIGGGCGRPPGTELTVSAAASLKGALTEAAEAYQKRHPEVKISLNFASSGSLARQIEQGAPVDVFLSAARREMDGLQEKGLIDPATRRDLLANRLALVVAAAPREAPGTGGVRGWEDLGGPGVARLAIGIPETVPCGQYAQETLQHLGLWEKVQPKLVLAKDVWQIVSYVKTGNVDAGVVFLTDSRDPGLRVVAEAPEGSHRPVVYPAAAVKSSRLPRVARDFLDFLAGREAAAIFSKYGFVPLGHGG